MSYKASKLGRLLLALPLAVWLLCGCSQLDRRDDPAALEQIISNSPYTIVVFIKDAGCASCDAYLPNAVDWLKDQEVYFVTFSHSRKKVIKELIKERFSMNDIPDRFILGASDLQHLRRLAGHGTLFRSNLFILDSKGTVAYSHLDHDYKPKPVKLITEFLDRHEL